MRHNLFVILALGSNTRWIFLKIAELYLQALRCLYRARTKNLVSAAGIHFAFPLSLFMSILRLKTYPCPLSPRFLCFPIYLNSQMLNTFASQKLLRRLLAISTNI